MDRKVPQVESEEIELYIRTYYSLLRSSDEVQIKSLVEAHAQMDSSLHLRARSTAPDLSAFIYSSLRLPACIRQVRLVVLGQSREVFERHGFPLSEGWQSVGSPARRRRAFFNGQDTLAVYIASHSDIDDLIPLLTAYQIEWNKFNLLLRGYAWPDSTRKADDAELARVLEMKPADLARLRRAWVGEFWDNLRTMAAVPKKFAVRLLAGSLNDYRRATLQWYEHVEKSSRPPVDLRGRPA
ncbi:MAG: DUF6909 family protein, partial [Longimicrobiales bacterium]